jgi:hypothetical protein
MHRVLAGPRFMFLAALLVVLFQLPLASAHADLSLRLDAVGAAGGGESTNSEYRLSNTIGLPAIGMSVNLGSRETVGFWFGPVVDVIAVSEAASPVPPRTTRLYPNHPNPFNPSTRIAFDIAGQAGQAVPTHLGIFDVGGRLVRTLVNDNLAPGSYECVWEGRDSRLRPVASGVYFGRLQAGNAVKVKRLVLMK